MLSNAFAIIQIVNVESKKTPATSESELLLLPVILPGWLYKNIYLAIRIFRY